MTFLCSSVLRQAYSCKCNGLAADLHYPAKGLYKRHATVQFAFFVHRLWVEAGGAMVAMPLLFAALWDVQAGILQTLTSAA